jgi:hypothetical protein
MALQEVLPELDSRKQFVGRVVAEVARLLMFSRLLQIRALGGAIERHFPLLTATLGTDAVV